MNIKELKEQLLQGTFYYYKDALLIHAKVKNICELTSCLHIDFEGGAVDVATDKIKPIRRPGNIVEKFNWCYILKNYEAECIGYIGQIEDK
ncbi:hypothetical protein [Clostridium butyricum]|uniref:hypothetical protein n=1 Tax=Clostridium butyricum TaxID=1492 RepID=UPI0034677D5C